MKTEGLIAALAADTRPGPTAGQRLARALPLGIGVAAVAFALVWGPRPDIAAALASLTVLKTLVPLVLAVLAWAVCVEWARPGARPVMRVSALALFVAALIAALAQALAGGGLSGLADALSTPSLLICLVSIPALSLPLLAAVLWSLSAGAALRPGLVGAMGGCAAGGGAAALYSLYCDQDAALFVLPAYAAATLVVTLIGAAAGARLLKW
ncbi:MAG: DUF1109 family protein [Rhodobacteraceae bacterium]|nr:DUF1109 family protein [Paracoccaceae bacterium]